MSLHKYMDLSQGICNAVNKEVAATSNNPHQPLPTSVFSRVTEVLPGSMARIFQLIAFISGYNPAIQPESYFCLRLRMVPMSISIESDSLVQRQSYLARPMRNLFNPFPYLSDTLPSFVPSWVL